MRYIVVGSNVLGLILEPFSACSVNESKSLWPTSASVAPGSEFNASAKSRPRDTA
jgi:hypothetical protein